MTIQRQNKGQGVFHFKELQVQTGCIGYTMIVTSAPEQVGDGVIGLAMAAVTRGQQLLELNI